METLRELLDSLKIHVRDRVANPLYVAFVISWIVYNYRFLMVMVGEGTWREKIAFIDSTLYPSPEHTFHRGFVYPLLTAVLFIVLAPFVRRWVTVFIAEREAVTIGELLRVNQQTPLSPAAADTLRRSLIEQRQNHLVEKREFHAKLTELNAQLDLLADQNLQATTAAKKFIGAHQATLPTAIIDGNEVFRLRGSDFVGGTPKGVSQLEELGLTRDQARALHVVRNEPYFSIPELQVSLGLPDDYAARVIVDKLRGLGLATFSQQVTGQFEITSLGRQALAAVTARGFDPNGAA